MDNNFEQSFMQQVRQGSSASSSASSPSVMKDTTPNSTPSKSLVTTILLSIIIVLQVVTIVTLIAMPRTATQPEEVIEYDDDTPDYSYNDDGSIRTMSLTCESDQGYYLFYPSGDYEKYDLAFDQRQDTGSYSFVGEDVLLLDSTTTGSRKLSYANDAVTEESIQYSCNSGADYETTE